MLFLLIYFFFSHFIENFDQNEDVTYQAVPAACCSTVTACLGYEAENSSGNKLFPPPPINPALK